MPTSTTSRQCQRLTGSRSKTDDAAVTGAGLLISPPAAGVIVVSGPPKGYHHSAEILARVHEQVSRIDRTHPLHRNRCRYHGAVAPLPRFLLFYGAATLSSVGYTGVSL